MVTGVEQLKSGANCSTDGDTFKLFHTSQITIIMDPADQRKGCTLIRAGTLNQSICAGGLFFTKFVQRVNDTMAVAGN